MPGRGQGLDVSHRLLFPRWYPIDDRIRARCDDDSLSRTNVADLDDTSHRWRGERPDHRQRVDTKTERTGPPAPTKSGFDDRGRPPPARSIQPPQPRRAAGYGIGHRAHESAPGNIDLRSDSAR